MIAARKEEPDAASKSSLRILKKRQNTLQAIVRSGMLFQQASRKHLANKGVCVYKIQRAKRGEALCKKRAARKRTDCLNLCPKVSDHIVSLIREVAKLEKRACLFSSRTQNAEKPQRHRGSSGRNKDTEASSTARTPHARTETQANPTAHIK